ncbi:MAG TPA: formylmethanofuran dehydrogenase subunit E family protein [Candidatus Gastranaerophilales bacterium]|nr:formylmethanofuran dehydrogenase subunit E family protein [Candidatus Gastranaerophilales bacterium]
MKRIRLLLLIILLSVLISSCNINRNSISEWYYPDWAVNARYNQSIKVMDTESALGRYALKTKEITLKDLALIHGHLCDGLVISYIQIKAVLEKLFPDGIVDRTDLRAVSKNGPCWVDAISTLTGTRTNFGTLSIQPEIGDGFIIQRISTGESYSVHLKNGLFPKELTELENKIRKAGAEKTGVNPEDIDKVEKMANNLSRKLLNSMPEEILDIKKIDKYKFEFKFETAKRGDIINKDVSR